MAKRKAAKNQAADGKAASDSVEPMVVALAAQLGTFLGRVQRKADGLLENAALRKQASQIRDGAADLLKLVNRAGVVARKTVAKQVAAKKPKGKSAAKSTKGRTAVDMRAPAKRLRKPPPEELFDPRLGEPMGKQMGQKSLKRGRSGRG